MCSSGIPHAAYDHVQCGGRRGVCYRYWCGAGTDRAGSLSLPAGDSPFVSHVSASRFALPLCLSRMSAFIAVVNPHNGNRSPCKGTRLLIAKPTARCVVTSRVLESHPPCREQISCSSQVSQRKRVFIFGGVDDRGEPPENKFAYFNDVWCANLAKMSWRRLPSTGATPSPRAYATMARVNAK